MLRDMRLSAGIPLIARAETCGDTIAVLDATGEHTYTELLMASERVASALLDGRSDLAGERVCYLIGPNFSHVAVQWGIFRAGGVAVPLCVSHPAPELAHVLDDAKPTAVIAGPEFEARLAPLASERDLSFLAPNALLTAAPAPLPDVDPFRPALLIYTSGTTGKPKGAISTHGILGAQMQSVVTAWQLSPSDRILHVLPLHHLHGILNALCAVLYAGGSVELMPRFDALEVLRRFMQSPELTLFMAVPTIYAKLLEVADALNPAERAGLRERLAHLRLMVSGSAALPVSVLARFEELSGHVLLERYGMTELGMALGNPLHGERRAGSVGLPFPDVEARIVDETGRELDDDQAGELQIRGPNVFAGYFGKPDESAAAFTSDGFFRTGDVAIREGGYYRLLGRASVDIIKTGGFKVSALEIEETLREHPAIADVAVVAVPDPEWGERVAAAVVLRPGSALELEELRQFGKERLATYKVPSLLCCVESLPRNALGKVQKPALSALWT
jgi:malonyl-CoA/methylmalonyl-CoA synthetase